MDLYHLPWRRSGSGLVRLRLPATGPVLRDEIVHVSAADDDGDGTIVAIRRSGGNVGPLACVIEQSQDGVTWVAVATINSSTPG
jgi:hypothetical protein